MSELSLRLLLLLHVVVPLLFFIASVYLALRVLFARFIMAPASPVLWFVKAKCVGWLSSH